jgi:hypothetical protein
MIGTPAPLTRLAGAAAEYEVRVAALIGDDDDMVEYLHRLEQLADDDTEQFSDLELDDDDEFDPIDAGTLDPDALVEEVEQFLRDRTDD